MQVTFPNPLVPRMSAQQPRAPTAHAGPTLALYSHIHSARGQKQHGQTHRQDIYELGLHLLGKQRSPNEGSLEPEPNTNQERSAL